MISHFSLMVQLSAHKILPLLLLFPFYFCCLRCGLTAFFWGIGNKLSFVSRLGWVRKRGRGPFGQACLYLSEVGSGEGRCDWKGCQKHIGCVQCGFPGWIPLFSSSAILKSNKTSVWTEKLLPRNLQASCLLFIATKWNLSFWERYTQISLCFYFSKRDNSYNLLIPFVSPKRKKSTNFTANTPYFMLYSVIDYKNHHYFTDCYERKKYYQFNLHNVFLT